MAPRIWAMVRPEMLRWARESIGISIDEAAQKIGVKPEGLGAWERGETRPTIPQLRKAAWAYRRPLAVFYLSEPPRGFEPLKDFRRLPYAESPEYSPNLRLAIREAHHRRALAIDLSEQIGELPLAFSLSVSLHEDPELISRRIRAALGVALQEQVEWNDAYQALNVWRAAAERSGLLVFQATGVSVEEMRGFSIGESPLPVIGLNTKDSPTGRIFTLLHELVHLALSNGGLCNLDQPAGPSSEQQTVEVFANRVAGAVLVPRGALVGDPDLADRGYRDEWPDQLITRLARRYRVSAEVILRRLLILGWASDEYYQRRRAEFVESYQRLARRPSSGGPPIDLKTVRNKGLRFVSLVLDAYYAEAITLRDLSDYLDVRVKHLPSIEKRVMDEIHSYPVAQ